VALFPKEHGAYGQISFPLIAAFGVAGVSAGGLLLAAVVIAGFLAHEPALVVLGLRGPRAKRELWRPAAGWLVLCVLGGAAAACGAWLLVDEAARWSLAAPLVPALVLAMAMARGREKSWYGETAAALAFSAAAVPISIAGGVSPATAAAVAIPFALLFVSSTLAVRVVILRVRGGGDPRAAAITRGAALTLAIGGGILLWLTSANGFVATSASAAAAPGLLVAAVIALRPPAPAQLRTLGWTLVAVSVLTTAIVVTTT
jgi:YwiC-like protein